METEVSLEGERKAPSRIERAWNPGKIEREKGGRRSEKKIKTLKQKRPFSFESTESQSRGPLI